MSRELLTKPNCRENFEALVATYRRRLYLYALNMLRNHEDAEDAVQDALVRAYRAYNTMEAKPLNDARLSAWLLKITLNVVRNRFRRKQLVQVPVDALNDPHSWHSALEDRLSPDVVVDQNATFALVERAIRDLPSHLLEAARLRFIEGLSHSEIARRCSQPEGTVKAKVFRAGRRLRQILEPTLGASLSLAQETQIA